VTHVLFVFGVAACAAAFACWEIQIEGSAGWASALPTWRVDNAFTRIFFSGRPLTGYHLYAHLFVILIAHLPVWLGFGRISAQGEAKIWSFLIFFWITEDFLWFAFNPEFGLKRFRPDHIWWHAPTWWWIMPRDYWVFGPIGGVLYWWAQRL